jgi:hypothetical protein
MLLETSAAGSRIRDHQQGLEDKAEMVATARQLVPLLDRLGRVFIDTAAWVQGLADNPEFTPESVESVAESDEGLSLLSRLRVTAQQQQSSHSVPITQTTAAPMAPSASPARPPASAPSPAVPAPFPAVPAQSPAAVPLPASPMLGAATITSLLGGGISSIALAAAAEREERNRTNVTAQARSMHASSSTVDIGLEAPRPVEQTYSAALGLVSSASVSSLAGTSLTAPEASLPPVEPDAHDETFFTAHDDEDDRENFHAEDDHCSLPDVVQPPVPHSLTVPSTPHAEASEVQDERGRFLALRSRLSSCVDHLSRIHSELTTLHEQALSETQDVRDLVGAVSRMQVRLEDATVRTSRLLTASGPATVPSSIPGLATVVDRDTARPAAHVSAGLPIAPSASQSSSGATGGVGGVASLTQLLPPALLQGPSVVPFTYSYRRVLNSVWASRAVRNGFLGLIRLNSSNAARSASTVPLTMDASFLSTYLTQPGFGVARAGDGSTSVFTGIVSTDVSRPVVPAPLPPMSDAPSGPLQAPPRSIFARRPGAEDDDSGDD